MNTKKLIDWFLLFVNTQLSGYDYDYYDCLRNVDDFSNFIARAEDLFKADITCSEIDDLDREDKEAVIALSKKILDKATWFVNDAFYETNTLGMDTRGVPKAKDVSGELMIHYGRDNILVFTLLDASIADAFSIVMFNVIARGKFDINNLRHCPKCGKLFYPHVRLSKLYCSKSCSDMGRSGNLYDKAKPLLIQQ